MIAVLQQSRFAMRQLLNAPWFSLTVVLTLALGIGATTAIFSLVEGVLLRPLPFRDPGKLLLVGDRLGSGSGPNVAVTAHEIDTYSTGATGFSSMGAFHSTSFELSSSGANP